MRPYEAKNAQRKNGAPTSLPLKPVKLQRRSRVTNGKLFVELRNANSPWARRLRDLITLHISDLGGPDAISEAEKMLVRRSAMLALQCEMIEQRWAANGGEASDKSLLTYQRVAGSLRRILKSLGLGRRTKDVTPTLDQYLSAKANTEDIEEEGD
jgi:hypothetical protein